MKLRQAVVCGILLLTPVWARRGGPAECGTEQGLQSTERFLHKQAQVRRVAEKGTIQTLATPSASNNYDVDGIAVIDDSDGVVSRRNPFSLGTQTVRFAPVRGGGYRIELPPPAPYAGITGGSPLTGLADDDTRLVNLPFSFPFYANSYRSVYVNSDGNITFTAGDVATSDRSVSRFNAGPPRIAPLFTDLDPSRKGAAVWVQKDAAKVVISWDSVPVYTDGDIGPVQTFQVKLYPDGTIEFAYAQVSISGSSAVIGIAPGLVLAPTELVPLVSSAGRVALGGVGEFFTDVEALDLAAATQKFFQTHEDSYDYLFVFNARHLYINAGQTIAFEDTVRNSVRGYGVEVNDDGLIFGSPRRLQAAMNMGPMEQYPADPYAPIPARGGSGDTGLSILGHEAGHRFLAWTSVRDATGTPVMWGRSNVHWSFNFNSEASVDEGNRIRDNGPAANPRFTTTATVQGYSPLDQYFFGWRAATDVPAVFAVTDGDGPANATGPRVGVSFNGRRFDISMDDIIAVAGARVPDVDVAQRNYRFGFVLVQSATDPLDSGLLAQCAKYRAQWTSYWSKISGGRSTADVAPARTLNVSFWPSAELTLGTTLEATVLISAPLDHDMSIGVEAPLGVVVAPAAVVLPAGETSVKVVLQGVQAGVEIITLRPEDGAFEVVETRVRVS